jgi:phasin family protein
MPAKASTAKAANGTKTAAINGAEIFHESFEKAAKGYEELTAFGKDNAAALLQSAQVASKGMETLGSELLAFSKQSVEESIAATQAMLASKSLNELFQLQSDFSKMAFTQYRTQAAKFGELALSLAKEASEPLNARMAAFAALAQPASV